MNGKVFLIGAGPGDYKLLTLRAKECIENADVIVYDRLAGRGILRFAPRGAELIYVGKEADNHTVPQDGINAIILQKALEGKRVARVKGGDPFLFGRGGEEAEILHENGVEYEIVPGITSAIAVPAYAGIPVTHRDYSSSVHIITGHGKQGKDADFLDYKVLAKLKGTLVFLMGLMNIGGISRGLIAAGMKGTTPVAVIEKGTTSQQRTIVTTLEDAPGRVLEAGLKSPAVIVVGDVVRLEGKLSWLPKGRLAGKRIVVTRAREQAAELVEAIEERGGEAVLFPTIRTAEPQDHKNLDKALENLNSYSWIVFTSINGVKAFFERMKKNNIDIRKLYGVKLCAVGSITEKELNSLGLVVDFVPEKFTTANILKGLAGKLNEKDRVLLVRGDLANAGLPEELKDAGVRADDVVVYRTVPDGGDLDELIELLEGHGIDFVTFTSPSAVKNFSTALGENSQRLNSRIKSVCIGPVTSEAAEDAGMKVAGVADAYTIEGLVEKLEQLSGG